MKHCIDEAMAADWQSTEVRDNLHGFTPDNQVRRGGQVRRGNQVRRGGRVDPRAAWQSVHEFVNNSLELCIYLFIYEIVVFIYLFIFI